MNPTLPVKKPFANSHPSDRNFFLIMLLIVWAAILSGFIYDMIDLNNKGLLHFPWITHVHAALFVGWLVLFTAQILFIRTRNHAIHMKLGLLGVVIAGAMVIAGFTVAVTSEARKFGTPMSDPAFIAIMFSDMFVFGVLAGAGMYLRKKASAHKRLMLMATLALTDAGFGRWLSFKVAPLIGKDYYTIHSFSEGFFPFFMFQSFWPMLLMLAVGAYDLITRKRLHPVYLPALGWWLLFNLLECYLYYSPEWLQLCKRMIGHG